MTRMTRAQTAVFSVASAVILALTAGSFLLSYAHLAEIAGAHGPDDWRLWVWPGCLDAFILGGELLVLLGALRGERDRWGYGLTAAGSVGSIVLNVWGVGRGAPVLDYVVAGVPPTAALLGFAALMHQLHQLLAGVPAAAEVVPAGVRLLPVVAGRAPLVPVEPRPEPAAELPELKAELTRLDKPAAGARPNQRLQVFGDFVPLLEPALVPAGTERGTGHDQHERHGAAKGQHNLLAPAGTARPHPEPAVVPPVPAAGSGAADIQSEDTENTRLAAQAALVRNWLQAEPELTGTEIGTRLAERAGRAKPYSDSYGRRVRRVALGEGR